MKLFVKRTAPFSILWTLTNYLYLLALRKLTATDVSALYCCHKAFVFLLSWIVLKDRFMGVRVSEGPAEANNRAWRKDRLAVKVVFGPQGNVAKAANLTKGLETVVPASQSVWDMI